MYRLALTTKPKIKGGIRQPCHTSLKVAKDNESWPWTLTLSWEWRYNTLEINTHISGTPFLNKQCDSVGSSMQSKTAGMAKNTMNISLWKAKRHLNHCWKRKSWLKNLRSVQTPACYGQARFPHALYNLKRITATSNCYAIGIGLTQSMGEPFMTSRGPDHRPRGGICQNRPLVIFWFGYMRFKSWRPAKFGIKVLSLAYKTQMTIMNGLIHISFRSHLLFAYR